MNIMSLHYVMKVQKRKKKLVDDDVDKTVGKKGENTFGEMFMRTT